MKIHAILGYLLLLILLTSCNSHSHHIEFKIELDGNDTQQDLSILKERIYELSGEQAEIITLPHSVYHFKLKSFQDSSLLYQAIQTQGDFEICESYGLLELYPILMKLNTELIGSNSLPAFRLIDTSEFVKNNPLFSILMPNTTEETSLVSGTPIIGYVLSKDTSTLFQLFNLTSSKLLLPRGLTFELGKLINEQVYPIYAKKYKQDDDSNINEQMFEKVSVGKAEDRDDFEINITLKDPFKKKFSDLTKRNIQKSLIMSFDHTVLSAPIVQSEISGGRLIINSNFNHQEAFLIAACLKYGVLSKKPKVLDFAFVKNN
ncbi:MAG: SecDF P1 head subdomain-containing protein [Bacteroidia bacterium]